MNPQTCILHPLMQGEGGNVVMILTMVPLCFALLQRKVYGESAQHGGVNILNSYERKGVFSFDYNV